ncbi:MAG: hypothetical protein LBK95_04855 [Bifidobacteriaceae bacterium]|jgi:hypothetical protein|nr:hypothetical protein [Bifidobacteriaceae bacterium]
MPLLDSLARLAPVTSWRLGRATTAQTLDAGVPRLDLSRLAPDVASGDWARRAFEDELHVNVELPA